MAEPTLAVTRLAGDGSAAHLLVVGPSLGTGVVDLWGRCAALLPSSWEVVGWDLPGHGAGTPTTVPFTITGLAAEVRGRAAAIADGRPCSYAGVSLGGAVGFVLAGDPGPFGAVVALASGPTIGTPDGWRERAAQVRRTGTAGLVEGSAARWFAPGLIERSPGTASRLLRALQRVDDESYALACEALAELATRDRPAPVLQPLVVVGADDAVVPPGPGAVVLPGVGHLPPFEAPRATADLITTHLDREQR